MIDLGKGKEVTAVLNFKLNFLQKNFQSFSDISVFGHQDLSNDICQTPFTFSGLKLHLELNLNYFVF